MDFFPRFEQFCYRILERFPTLNERFEFLEEKTGKVLPKHQILLVFISIAFGLLVFFFGSVILTFTLCVFLPALRSVRAIDGCNQNKSSFWLKYWILYSSVNIFEIIFNFIICRIPYYFLLKIGFFIWCSNLSFKGADILYGYISPFIRAEVLSLQVQSSPVVEEITEIENEQTLPSSRQLRVIVKKAVDLPLSPGFEHLSPYCVLELKPKVDRKLLGAEQSKFKTKCKENTQNPNWFETITFHNIQRLDAYLILTIFDKQTTMNDRKIGSVQVDLSDASTMENSSQFDLVNDGVLVGSIYLDCSVIEF